MTERKPAQEPAKKKVRTTMRPEVELEVTPQEELDLKRQGLLAKNAKGEQA